MSCERYREAITDHACGAPIEDVAAAHLDVCHACRQAFDEHRQLLADAETDLRKSLMVTGSADFTARVSARVRWMEQARSSWVLVPRWAIAAAAVGVIAVSLYFGLSHERRDLESAGGPSAAVPNIIPPEPQTTAATESPNASSLPQSREPAKRPAAPLTKTLLRTVSAHTAEDPPVIVPPDQQRALARLRELLRNGLLDEVNVPAAPTSSELVIEPLTISELQVRELESAGSPDLPGGHRQ